MESESKEVPCMERTLSKKEFSTDILSKNFPLVLKDCVKSWPAFRKWNPSSGGLSYLKTLAGYAVVQAMMTKSGSNFYGNIREHERVAMPFGMFMDLANTYYEGVEEHRHSTLKGVGKQHQVHPKREIQNRELENVSKFFEKDASTFGDEESFLSKEFQFYLAQVPILLRHQKEEPPLGPLIKDIFVPEFLNVESVSNINLWMSCGGSRSSTHYDPYHNLLCVVSGHKKVTLWSPSAAPVLYPMPLSSEASNHSAVDFAHPNLDVFPLFKDASNYSWTTMLGSGDALYIPEGWYHQVDSEGVTLAVNIWWPSAISKELSSHMDAYYLRRVLASLMDTEKERMLGEKAQHNRLTESVKEKLDMSTSDGYHRIPMNPSCFKNIAKQESFFEAPVLNDDNHTTEKDSVIEPKGYAKPTLEELDPFHCSLTRTGVFQKESNIEVLAPSETDQLRTLVLSVGSRLEHMADAQNTSSTSCSASDLSSGSDGGIHSRLLIAKGSIINDFSQAGVARSPVNPCTFNDEDIIAEVFKSTEPPALQRILLKMVKQFPRTLEALILHSLSPIAAEILTKKFEEMDECIPEAEQTTFYEKFYSIFDDSRAAMEVLLAKKEAFSAKALSNVMIKYLG